MGKKILSKKNIISFFSGLAIIGTIIDLYVLRTGIAKWVFSLFKWLFNFINQKMPNFVLNLLIVAILGGLVYISIKLRELLKANIGKLRKDFDNHLKKIHNDPEHGIDKKIRDIRTDLSGIYDKAKKYEQLDTSPEIIFILETLGAKLDMKMTRRNLRNYYVRKFRPKTSKEANLIFNMKINWLDKRGYIEKFEERQIGFVKITSIGLEYHGWAKIKIAEENKK